VASPIPSRYFPDRALVVKVLFISSEVAPFAKTGGLADVSAALPRHLAAAGHELVVVTPLYDRSPDTTEPVTSWGDIRVPLGSRTAVFTVRSSVLPGSEVPVYFIDCPPLYHRGSVYTNDADEHLRFILLSRGALEICQRLNWSPDIVHANDWQTALVPLYLRSVYAWDQLFANTKSVITIHNLGYQGSFPAYQAADLGLGDASYMLHQEQLNRGRLNFLAHGIMYADAITTVSPTYAWEIQTPENGAGLDGMLRARAHDLVGILNGIDPHEWHPGTDRHIPFHFSAKSLWRKEKNKEALLVETGLPYQKGVPTVGMVSRLTTQKGIDLLVDAMTWYLQRVDLRFVALGSGERRYEEKLAALAARFPDRAAFRRGYDNGLAHLIEAGADIFPMPSRYEPCGLNQMYSLAYGTAPVVRKTGGLADTVTHFDTETGEGNGFVFEHHNAQGLAWALGQALEVHADKGAWQQLQRNAMAVDNSWTMRAGQYVDIYRRLIG